MKNKSNFKKIAVFLGVFLFFAMILSGCGKKNETFNDRGFRMPDFGQPEREADLSGIVKSVTGNEVTILKIERPNFNQDNTSQNADQESSNQNAPAIGMTTGQGMRGGPGMMGGGRPEMDKDTQSAMFEKMKEMSTGEEVITIPIGIQMLKPSIDSEQRAPEMLEASLSDISSDVMIRVWLDESVTDKNVATFVMITQ